MMKMYWIWFLVLPVFSCSIGNGQSGKENSTELQPNKYKKIFKGGYEGRDAVSYIFEIRNDSIIGQKVHVRVNTFGEDLYDILSKNYKLNSAIDTNSNVVSINLEFNSLQSTEKIVEVKETIRATYEQIWNEKSINLYGVEYRNLKREKQIEITKNIPYLVAGPIPDIFD